MKRSHPCGLNNMSQKQISVQLCFLILLISSSIPTFTVINPNYPNFNDFSLLQNSNHNSYIIEDHSLDFLVMFFEKIPNLGSFKPLVIKKFSGFPVIHIKFNNSDIKQQFYQKYSHHIYRIEQNEVLKSSLHTNPEINPKITGINTEIQDSTGASFLHDSLDINGRNIKIGIIDTGVEIDSVKFGTRVKGRESFVSIDNGYSADISDPDDNIGHGTNVASLTAGSTTGIAPEAEIYSAKVIERNIRGSGNGIEEETTAGLLEAIDYLINNSVEVINISLGQYHNLPSGLRDEVINYASIIHNIVFSVSAGNAGTPYGDRGTLYNPSTALQCIAATASDIAGTFIANFASRGPKVDYSLKPDITAPGINTPWQGTSFAAPIVAGAAALLIDYLKTENLTYSAATIKAALLAGARTLNKPVWEEGAGFLNITRSLEILNSTDRLDDTPDLLYLHPQKLPFDPYEILFNGSTVVFNLTVISSRNINANIIVSESILNFVSTLKSSYIINNTTLIPINFSIPASAESQYVSGFINVDSETLMVEFEIRETNVQILFDESLNQIVRHGYNTGAYEIQGDTSSTIGMYSAFTQFLAYENNYSITPHVKGEITLKELSKYDVLILANPLSNTTDKYMDWVVNPDSEYYHLSDTTMEAISQFVASGGGVLILNSINDAYYNITGLNEFLMPFGFQIQTEFLGNIGICDIVNPQDFTTDISSFPFQGNYIQVNSGNNSQIIAEYNGYPTLASYEDPGGGRVLLFGSDLIFDNIGFSSHAYSGTSTDNRILALNSVTWLAGAEREYFRTSTSIPEFPLPLLFLILIFSLIIIYLLFMDMRKS